MDGPFKLKGYTSPAGLLRAEQKLSGPNKPKVSQFVEVPFTSADAEYNALRAGSLTSATYRQPTVRRSRPLRKRDITPRQWKVYGFSSIFYNFNNPSVGPGFQQLYVRQAMQYLMDQQLQISKVFSGYAQPDYGMVVNGPSSEMQAEPNAIPVQPSQGQGPADGARLGCEARRHDYLRASGNGRQ